MLTLGIHHSSRDFNTDCMVSINNAMLSYLSPNHTFMIRLMGIPWKCHHEMTYGVVVDQETMRHINLYTSVCDNSLSRGKRQITMVPRDYRSNKSNRSWKNQLSKHPTEVLGLPDTEEPVKPIETPGKPNHLFRKCSKAKLLAQHTQITN